MRSCTPRTILSTLWLRGVPHQWQQRSCAARLRKVTLARAQNFPKASNSSARLLSCNTMSCRVCLSSPMHISHSRINSCVDRRRGCSIRAPREGHVGKTHPCLANDAVYTQPLPRLGLPVTHFPFFPQTRNQLFTSNPKPMSWFIEILQMNF